MARRRRRGAGRAGAGGRLAESAGQARRACAHGHAAAGGAARPLAADARRRPGWPATTSRLAAVSKRLPEPAAPARAALAGAAGSVLKPLLSWEYRVAGVGGTS